MKAVFNPIFSLTLAPCSFRDFFAWKTHVICDKQTGHFFTGWFYLIFFKTNHTDTSVLEQPICENGHGPWTPSQSPMTGSWWCNNWKENKEFRLHVQNWLHSNAGFPFFIHKKCIKILLVSNIDILKHLQFEKDKTFSRVKEIARFLYSTKRLPISILM